MTMQTRSTCGGMWRLAAACSDGTWQGRHSGALRSARLLIFLSHDCLVMVCVLFASVCICMIIIYIYIYVHVPSYMQ